MTDLEKLKAARDTYVAARDAYVVAEAAYNAAYDAAYAVAYIADDVALDAYRAYTKAKKDNTDDDIPSS